MSQNQAQQIELGAKEISERLGLNLRTVQRWLRDRRDIFPNARQTGPNWNSPLVTLESDVIAYEQKYLRKN